MPALGPPMSPTSIVIGNGNLKLTTTPIRRSPPDSFVATRTCSVLPFLRIFRVSVVPAGCALIRLPRLVCPVTCWPSTAVMTSPAWST